MRDGSIEKYFTRPDKKQCTDCGIALVLFFLAVGLYTHKEKFFLIAFFIQLVIAIWPLLLTPLAYGWFGLSRIMGKLMSGILLGIVFFVVLTPVAIVRKLMGKDRLMLRKFKKDRSSVFLERVYTFQSADLEHPY